MKIHEITYDDPGAPDGKAREFFVNVREMRARIVEIKKNHAAELKAREDAEAAGVDFYDLPKYPVYRPDTIQQNTIVLTGTSKEMVLQALRHGR